MDDNLKYVMLPRIEEKTKNVKSQPWYKERLREKYLTKNSNNKEKIIDPKQWIFVKDGLDDFRDGIPPPCEDVLIKPSKGPAPTVKNQTWKFKEPVIPISKRLNRNQRFFSKKIPLAEAKQESIEQIINGLAQHPLALYPHLEETLPPDLFETLLEILDPEINEQTDSIINEFETGSDKNRGTDEVLYKERRNIKEDLKNIEDNLLIENADNLTSRHNKTVKNTYKWLLRKEEAKARTKGPEPEQIKAQAIDNHIKNVTEEFCSWVKSLGGEHNIDPVTLTSLFASGYDTKPALSVPIHVVELTNIPQELRPSAYVPLDPNNKNESTLKNVFRDEHKSKKTNEFRYGAWYLPKKHWKLMPADQKLVDPKIIKEADKDESKRKSEEINSKLAPLHGAHAFKQFIKSKQPKRVPKLIAELDKWEIDQKPKTENKSISNPDLNETSHESEKT